MILFKVCFILIKRPNVIKNVARETNINNSLKLLNKDKFAMKKEQ